MIFAGLAVNEGIPSMLSNASVTIIFPGAR
jgi:hypothetical protein